MADYKRGQNKAILAKTLPVIHCTPDEPQPDVDDALPWVDKYRPHTLDQVIGNQEAIVQLKTMATQHEMPHLLLVGPSGTGKTTSILCLAHALLSHALDPAHCLQLNASDDRGIEVVRTKIVSFCKAQVTFNTKDEKNTLKIQHKIVVLDEADNMTAGAQQALRRVMQVYGTRVRFALACNIATKILPVVASRCVTLRFARLPKQQVLGRLQSIATVEKITDCTLDGLGAIVDTAQGDLRQAINTLQATHAGMRDITPENVYQVADQPHPLILTQVVKCCAKGDVKEALNAMLSLIYQGYAITDLMQTLTKVCQDETSLALKLKVDFLKEIATTQLHVTQGVTSRLQIAALIARLTQTSHLATSTGSLAQVGKRPPTAPTTQVDKHASTPAPSTQVDKHASTPAPSTHVDKHASTVPSTHVDKHASTASTTHVDKHPSAT